LERSRASVLRHDRVERPSGDELHPPRCSGPGVVELAVEPLAARQRGHSPQVARNSRSSWAATNERSANRGEHQTAELVPDLTPAR
jgi:hypothetical protein